LITRRTVRALAKPIPASPGNRFITQQGVDDTRFRLRSLSSGGQVAPPVLLAGSHDLSCAYFSRSSRLYSSLTALFETCPFRSLAIFRRSGSVGARDFRLNLARSGVAGADVLPNSPSNHPIVSSRTDRETRHYHYEFGGQTDSAAAYFKCSSPHGPWRGRASSGAVQMPVRGQATARARRWAATPCFADSCNIFQVVVQEMRWRHAHARPFLDPRLDHAKRRDGVFCAGRQESRGHQ
jgi:hypothetical protein